MHEGCLLHCIALESRFVLARPRTRVLVTSFSACAPQAKFDVGAGKTLSDDMVKGNTGCRPSLTLLLPDLRVYWNKRCWRNVLPEYLSLLLSLELNFGKDAVKLLSV